MSKPSTHVLVTDPYLTPFRFAQRLTAQAYNNAVQEMQLADTDFTVKPYSQALQRKLKALAKTGVWYI
jgi:hypothetical protein